MPSIDPIETHGESTGPAGDNRATTLTAADLRRILKGVTSVLSDADHNHGAALDDLQDRLESLGRAASAAKDKVPAEFAAAFERIEGGLGMLADRIADSQAERRNLEGGDFVAAAAAASAAVTAAVSAASARSPFDADIAAAVAKDVGPTAAASSSAEAVSPNQTPMHLTAPAAGPAGSALGSTTQPAQPASAVSSSNPEPQASDALSGPSPLSTGSGGPRGLTRAKLVPSTIDPFDVFDSTGDGEGDDPWDADDAEALTRVYEASGLTPRLTPQSPVAEVAAEDRPSEAPAVAGPALKPTMSLMDGARDVADVSGPMAGPSGADAGAGSVALAGIERDWLEERFAEIASRVEQSLAAMRTDEPLVALDERLGQFEERFGKVLDGVATRSDLEDLRQVEHQLGELNGHVESAQLQLQRLDTIEAQLNAVMEKLSDQRLSSFLEEAQGRDIDVQAIARSAAEQVASRLNEMTPSQRDGGAEVQRIEELRGLLNSFMTERRQGEEQTAGMLDTMQQAMIRLLDRVDSLELAATGTGEGYAVYDQPIDDGHYAPAPQPVATHVQPAAMAERIERVAEATSQPEPTPEPVARQAQPAQRPAAPAPRVAEADAASGGAAQTRDQLIAEARRAMIAAARQQQEEQQAADAQAATKGKKPGKAKKAAAAKAESTGGISPTTRRILVGACTLLLLSSAVLLMLPRKKATEIPPPKAFEQSTTSGKAAPAKGATDPKSVTKAKSGDKGADASEFLPSASGVSLAAADEGAQTSAPLPGIIVHHNGGLTSAEMAELQERRAMAEASTQVGSVPAGVSVQTAGVAGVTNALSIETGALQGQQAASEHAAPETASAGSMRVRPQDLPAAGVGPLSLRMAAASGDPSAEFEVAARFAEGKGVPQDFAMAVDWYQRSANRGFAVAQYRLGTLYERGLGVPTDTARARAWYAKAAEAGNIKAMHNLAVLSASRERGSPDYTTAAHWFQQAAERGLADSQYNIAVLYETGLGVSRDLHEAYKWFAIASRGGDKESKRRLELVKMKLDANEIIAGDRMIAGWRVHGYDRLANDPFVAGQAWKQRVGTSAS